MNDLAAGLRARIDTEGPMRLDAWMAACNGHYYAARDPFGAGGDFVTAPEISQMFGEMIGGWIADLWLRAARPALLRLVELGPGRGTLMRDALRVMAGVPGLLPALARANVETSALLAAAQGDVPTFTRFADVPDDGPLIVIANEFFDALPIRQFPAVGVERAVTVAGDGFAATSVPAPGARAGEICEAGQSLAAAIAARIARHGGAALIIDYGHDGSAHGDTLQALRRHAAADPFIDPGTADLTAHVDFGALGRAATGVRVHGPVAQGVWLARLGIEARAAQLRSANPAQAASVAAALVRLTAPGQMGALFKAMAFSHQGWPVPAGFDA